MATYDAELVRQAIGKRKGGEKLTQREASALKAFEKEQLEKQRDAICRAIPKGVYCEWSGRPPQVVNSQGDRYRLPIRGRTVDLPEFIRAVHDFLAANKNKLSAGDADDPLLAGANSYWLEKYREEKWRLVRLDRLQQEGVLLRADDVHERMMCIASIIKQAGELLEKRHGPEASAILEKALQDAAAHIEAFGGGRDLYGEDIEGGSEETGPAA